MKTLGICAMQNYPTKRDKLEFIHMFKDDFDMVIRDGYWRNFTKQPMVTIIGEKARWFFNYSDAYPNGDITWNYLKLYIKHYGRKEE